MIFEYESDLVKIDDLPATLKRRGIEGWKLTGSPQLVQGRGYLLVWEKVHSE